MRRVTKKQIGNVFATFCKIHGYRLATSYKDVDGLRLDCNSCYGGWVIEKVCNEHGGVSRPFGETRMNSRQFLETLWFAIRVKECA